MEPVDYDFCTHELKDRQQTLLYNEYYDEIIEILSRAIKSIKNLRKIYIKNGLDFTNADDAEKAAWNERYDNEL